MNIILSIEPQEHPFDLCLEPCGDVVVVKMGRKVQIVLYQDGDLNLVRRSERDLAIFSDKDSDYKIFVDNELYYDSETHQYFSDNDYRS